MPVAAAVLPRHDLRRRASRLAPNRTTTARASPLKANPDRRPSHRRGRYLPALRRVQQRLALRRRRVAPRPLRRIGAGLGPAVDDDVMTVVHTTVWCYRRCWWWRRSPSGSPSLGPGWLTTGGSRPTSCPLAGCGGAA